MVMFALFLVAVCYVCYAVLQATNNGWLAKMGEGNVEFIQTLCKLIFFTTIFAPLVAFILSKVL